MKCAIAAILICVAGPVLAGDAEAGFSKARLAALSQVAQQHSTSPAAASNTYALEWQKQLLAFQVAYAATLTAPEQDIDTVETGSITAGR